MALFREFLVSTCRARLLVHRLVLSAALSACQAVSSAWWAVLSACQAAPWLSHFSPVPRLENWSVLPGKPMRVRPLASVISISSNSSGMVPCSTSAHGLGGEDREQGQHGGDDNSHIFAGDMLFLMTFDAQ